MRGREGPASLYQNCHCMRVTLLIQCLSPEWGQAVRRSGCVGDMVLGATPGLGQLQARPSAPSPSLPSSIYRSYFGNFHSELKAHSWDSVTAFPAGKPGISWRLPEPPGPWSALLQIRGCRKELAGPALSELQEASFHHPRVEVGVDTPLREADIPAKPRPSPTLQILPTVSASTCPTRLGMRNLSLLRT